MITIVLYSPNQETQRIYPDPACTSVEYLNHKLSSTLTELCTVKDRLGNTYHIRPKMYSLIVVEKRNKS